MSPRLQSFVLQLATLALIAAGFFFLLTRQAAEVAVEKVDTPVATSSPQTAAVNTSLETPPPPLPATSLGHSTTTGEATPKKVATTTVKKIAQAPAQQPVVQKEPDNQARRIQNPYSYAPVSFESINAITRPALVNILCRPRGTGPIASPISGSGVIIDPRGVILTNAHVAQYVLLAQSDRVNLSCAIRTGAPAIPRWSAEVLYIPPVWVEAHAREVEATHPVGTGEHDYALLRITGALDATPVPNPFPYLPFDVREAIGFKGDQVLAVSYPAEFLGGTGQFNMYSASSVTTIGQLMTFVTKSVDLISLGGIVGAQGGSSGGAVVNAWGLLIALISTTSEGETTAMRDLRAITLSYIDRDLAAQTRFDIATTLGGDVAAEALEFNTKIAPKLIELYLTEIEK